MTKTLDRKARQRELIAKHGQQLLAIFPDAKERDPVALCKQLRRLDARGAELALRLCNGPQFAEGEYERIAEDLLAKVNELLGNMAGKGHVPVFINGDPRGYALKIDDWYVREHDLQIHRDWGGYGILAPEITGD